LFLTLGGFVLEFSFTTKKDKEMPPSTVRMKKYYLGDTYPGQELCCAVVSVGETSVSCCTYVGTATRRFTFIDDAERVERIKSKLRNYWARCRTMPNVSRIATKERMAVITIYYPEVDAYAGMRNPRRKLAGNDGFGSV
jgi:hypothetical protein